MCICAYDHAISLVNIRILASEEATLCTVESKLNGLQKRLQYDINIDARLPFTLRYFVRWMKDALGLNSPRDASHLTRIYQNGLKVVNTF